MAKCTDILAFDIGSANIKALVGEVRRDGSLSIKSLYKLPSRGMRKGMVSDHDEVAGAVHQALVEIRRAHPEVPRAVFVGVGNAHARAQSSRGIVAVARADYQIHQDDMLRVEAAAQAVSMPPNRMIIHLINQEYAVDGVTGIKNPLGMVGNRLELSSMIVDVFEPAVKALTKAVETAGGEIDGLIFSPLAAAQSVLSRNQRDLGVVLIDLGADTTSMAVYEDGKLINIAVFPLGASNITNDLAIGLQISPEAAEIVKCSYGVALAKDVSPREMLDLRRIDARAKGAVSRHFIAEIIEARLAEIFELVNGELKRIGKAGRLPAGAVLVGGGSKMPGVTDAARQELRLPSHIGAPDMSRLHAAADEVVTKAEDPEFACAVGLLMWAKEHSVEPEGSGNGLKRFFKKLADYFMP